ncbi:MAG: hypothetical protein ACI9QD_000124 [Thermoproteota archaeon]|jgi:hypothetical protein
MNYNSYVAGSVQRNIIGIKIKANDEIDDISDALKYRQSITFFSEGKTMQGLFVNR